MLRQLAICLCIMTLAPLSILSSQLDNLSEHAKEVLLIGKYPLDSFTVLWHDTATGSIIVRSNPQDLVIEILHREEVFAVSYPFEYASEYSSLLIEQQLEWLNGPWETNYSELRASATYIDQVGHVQPAWSITEEADEGGPIEDFYVTTEYGCCDARPLNRAHRLCDGKRVMSYQSGLFAFAASEEELSDDVDRYVAIHVPAVGEDGGYSEDSSFVALLYYASRDSVLHVAQIRYIGLPITDWHWEPYYWEWSADLQDSDSILTFLQSTFSQLCVSVADSRRLPEISPRCLVLTVDKDIPAFVIPIRDDDFVIEPQSGSGYQIVRIR